MRRLLTALFAAAAVGGIWAFLAWLPPGVGGWTIRTELQIADPGHAQRVSAVAFAPRGGLLASGSWDRSIRLWDRGEGRSLGALRGHEGAIEALCFSPDGRSLIAGADDGAIRVWDVGNGRSLHRLQAGERPVTALAVSPDGTSLAAGTGGGEVRLWDLASGRDLGPLAGHDDRITGLLFTPDGERLASAALDGRILVRRLPDGEPTLRLRLDEAPPTALAIDPGGRRLAAAGAASIAVYRLPSGEPVARLTPPDPPVLALGFADAETLLSADGSGTVRHWDLAAGRPRRTVTRGPARVASLVFDARSEEVLAGGTDGTLRVWRTDGAEAVRILGAPALAVRASHDGERIATSHGSGLQGAGVVRVRDRRTGELRGSLWLEDRPAICLEWSPDDVWLGIWPLRGQVQAWNLGGRGSPAGAVLPGPPPPGPAKCRLSGSRTPHDPRFSVRLLEQVEGPEVFLEDARTGLLISLATDYVLAGEIPHRSPADRLWGRFGMVGVRDDGAVVVGRVEPRIPLPLGLFALVVLVLTPRAVLAVAGRR